MDDARSIWTIGHSNRTGEALLAMLRAHEVATVTDVRIYPRSRYNPQFNIENLGGMLRQNRLGYIHMRELGGNRQARPDSRNVALPAGTFRGYADYMETAAFQRALDRLQEAAATTRLALLCAEADPAHCHRSMIADALAAAGFQVWHICSETESALHQLRSECRLENGRPRYDGLQPSLPGLH
ncbi:MAG: DUF488 domain-containing protein [Bryobacterales bacterium]|nr:DUF488 domain-containing protein [Bryobacterales bacterium]